MHVAITQIVEHPALDSCRQGVKDVLAEAGYVEGKNLKWSYESAQGNMATAVQIAKKFVGEEPDVIVAIATPSAQAMVASTKTDSGGLLRRHRSGRRQAGQELGASGRQRDRHVGPCADRQAS